jgi:hypothetical protein
MHEQVVKDFPLKVFQHQLLKDLVLVFFLYLLLLIFFGSSEEIFRTLCQYRRLKDPYMNQLEHKLL